MIAAWTAKEIATIVGGYLRGSDDWRALEVSTDTRTLTAGQLFIALRGEHFCGEDFLQTAQERSAVAAMVQEYREIDIPQIVVNDTLTALQMLAAARRKQSNAFIIGLTGTNGKTSTKEMLYRILSAQGKTLATVGNLNNDIGVPLTLLRLQNEHRFAVIEMGANHPRDIERLVKIVCPDVAVITNVSAAHLQGFGSLDGVAAAKSEIYRFSSGALVVNADLPQAAAWLQEFSHRSIQTFALEQSAQWTAADISDNGQRFTLMHLAQRAEIAWQLCGRHNVANALAATAAASFAGVSLAQSAQALQGLRLQQSRLVALHVRHHTLYDDTYNANPASFKAAIEVIKTAAHSLVIAGKMGELGAQSAALHAEVAAFAREKGIKHFWALSAPDYAAGFPDARLFEDVEAVNQALRDILAGEKPYTVLVKGSRSACMERVIAALDIEKD